MKKLSRRDFLRITAIAGASVVLSKVPVPEVKEEIPKAIDAKLFIDDVEVLPNDVGGYSVDLSDEAIDMLTVNKSVMFGSVTAIPVKAEDNWYARNIDIKFYPDKDDPIFMKGKVTGFDPETGELKAEFNPSAHMEAGGLGVFEVDWPEPMLGEYFDKEMEV